MNTFCLVNTFHVETQDILIDEYYCPVAVLKKKQKTHKKTQNQQKNPNQTQQTKPNKPKQKTTNNNKKTLLGILSWVHNSQVAANQK